MVAGALFLGNCSAWPSPATASLTMSSVGDRFPASLSARASPGVFPLFRRLSGPAWAATSHFGRRVRSRIIHSPRAGTDGRAQHCAGAPSAPPRRLNRRRRRHRRLSRSAGCRLRRRRRPPRAALGPPPREGLGRRRTAGGHRRRRLQRRRWRRRYRGRRPSCRRRQTPRPLTLARAHLPAHAPVVKRQVGLF